MLEYSSISVSTYDAASLADRLTEKSAEGWDVVAIVSAGTNVTAYLSRSADAAAAAHATPAAEPAPAEPAAASEPAAEPHPADDSGPIEFSYTATATADDATSEPELTAADAALQAAVPAPEPEPVTEPAGWATEPEPASQPEPEPVTGGDSATDAVTSTEATTPWAEETFTPTEPEPAPAEPTVAPTPEPAPQPEPEPTPEPEPEPVQQAAAAAAPAGWYADPAGRFELRYWDGTQWTEHVSRAGQQYTDPPVA